MTQTSTAPADMDLLLAATTADAGRILDAMDSLTAYDQAASYTLDAVYDTLREHTTLVDRARFEAALNLLIGEGELALGGLGVLRPTY